MRATKQHGLNITGPVLSLAELEELQRHVLHRRRVPRRPVMGRWEGPAQSPFRGRGMELDDSRVYQPGDDVRYLDWRATARSGRPMSKVFREERQRQVYLVIDRSASMYFGTRVGAKAAAAARGAAILAFIALAEHDHVAGLVLDGARERAFPAARHLDGVLPLLRAAGAPMNADLSQPADWPAVWHHLHRSVDRGATLYLLSDLNGVDAGQRADLWRLAARCEVAVLHIVDPAELELPAAGRLRLTAGAGRVHTIDSDDPELRARYAAAMAERHATLQRLWRGVGAGFHRIHSERDVFDQLEGAL